MGWRQEPAGSNVFRDIVWGIHHDAFDNEIGKALIRAWSLGARDPKIGNLIQAQVHPLQVREAFGELLPFRKPRLQSGKIVLGASSDGREVRVPLPWLNAGLLLVGNTGASKTNLIKWLIVQIASLVKGLWTTDLYKQDLRHLKPLLSRVGVHWVVLRPRDLRLNILQAEGDPATYVPLAIDLLNRVLEVPVRAVSILRAVCFQLYDEFGIWRGRRDEWPTLFDCYEQIKATPGLNVPAREALLDRLGALLVQVTPVVAANRSAWKPSELSRYHIDFEMRGASEQIRTLTVSHLLFSVLYHRLEQGASNRRLDTVIAFEDAQRFFSDRSSTSQDITPVEEIAGLIRGTGISLWGACQSMAGLARGLIPNLTTKIMGRLGSHEDYRRLGADMGMNPQQIEWAKLHLGPGQFVAQVAEGQWRRPFVLKVPRLDVPSVVDDSQAAESVNVLSSLSVVPATEFVNWKPTHIIQIDSQRTDSRSPTALAKAELRLLQAVIDHPGRPSTQYCQLVGLSPKRAKEIRLRLVSLGYLIEHQVATGRRGRKAIVLEPTESGKATIQDIDTFGEGKGS